MSNEQQFWLAIWRTIGGMVCIIALTATGCDFQRNKAIKSLVEKGVDPIAAACAVGGVGDRNIAACTTLALKSSR